MRKTKIICTLGPSTDDEVVLEKLINAGMDVARFNFSHGNHEQHKNRLHMLINARKKARKHIASLLDTRGPEVRIGSFKEGKIKLSTGDIFTLTTNEIIGDKEKVSITYKDLPGDVQIGTRILIDDGLVEMIVESKTDTDIVCKVTNGAVLSNNKGVNIPGVHLSLPYISQKDREDIIFGIKNGFDFIAASFTRSAKDILEIRKILEEYNCTGIRIIAKIENGDGVKNIDEILLVSDGIMIARGDMGVEIPLEDVPVLQKELIKRAYNCGKQVITATQMLESMMKNPRPTRAESTDVANAIYDGTSAIMLSGETAAGLFPVEAVETMAKIAIRTENDIDYAKRFRMREVEQTPDVTNAISRASCTTAYDLSATAIIAVTTSGKTARMISKFRPQVPIIACTTTEKTARHMNMSWGVYPIVIPIKSTPYELFKDAVSAAIEEGIITNGDLVVISAGLPLGVSGTTNLIKVHIVGDEG